MEGLNVSTMTIGQRVKQFVTSHLEVVSIASAFFASVIFFALRSEHFRSAQNMLNIAGQTAPISIVAFGMTFVILSGGIDLSVGAIVSFAGIVAARVVEGGGNIWVGVIAALVTGCAFGLFNGTIIVKGKIQPFLVTLGALSIVKGLSLLLSGGQTRYLLDDTFQAVFGSGASLMAWTVFLLAVCQTTVRMTAFGRHVQAIGCSAVAARLSGVPVQLVKIRVYVISGLLAALSGLAMTGRLGSASAQVGDGMELDAIAAVVLGGTSFNGEGGSMFGTLFGALIMGTVSSGLNISGVDPYVQNVVKGAIIIAAVLIGGLRARGRES